MNGTAVPSSVVVVATSLGGFCGSYDWSDAPTAPTTGVWMATPPLVGSLDLYQYTTLGGSAQSRALDPLRHVHGSMSGPEKTGPLWGTFFTQSRAPEPSPSLAVIGVRPTGRPVTRPRSPGPAGRNALVTSRWPAVTLTRSRAVPVGTAISTRVSPPDTRSARPESVRTCTGPPLSSGSNEDCAGIPSGSA